MARASAALAILGSLSAFIAFWVFYTSGHSWCWMFCGQSDGFGAGFAVLLGLFGAYLARYRVPVAPLVLLAAGGVGFIDGDARYVIVTVVFLLAALVAWTSLDENAAGRTRADE